MNETIEIDGKSIICEKINEKELILKPNLLIKYKNKEIGNDYVKISYSKSENNNNICYVIRHIDNMNTLYEKYGLCDSHKVIFPYYKNFMNYYFEYRSKCPLDGSIFKLNYLPKYLEIEENEQWYKKFIRSKSLKKLLNN